LVRTAFEYCLTTGQTGVAWQRGATVDMSAGGLLVQLPDSLPLNAALTAAMDWPGLLHGTRTVRLFLNCRVVRVDSRGTALRIVAHEFRTHRPQKAAEVA
jgi:hypothetical protein